MMCAEKDAAFCLRSLLVGYHLLHEQNLDVQHLSFSGELESQTEVEKKLTSIHQLQQDLFLAEREQAAEGYRQQLIRHNYRKPGATKRFRWSIDCPCSQSPDGFWLTPDRRFDNVQTMQEYYRPWRFGEKVDWQFRGMPLALAPLQYQPAAI